jgi:hypothetical protein
VTYSNGGTVTYSKTTWVDGENKYDITTQAGAVMTAPISGSLRRLIYPENMSMQLNWPCTTQQLTTIWICTTEAWTVTKAKSVE